MNLALSKQAGIVWIRFLPWNSFSPPHPRGLASWYEFQRPPDHREMAKTQQQQQIWRTRHTLWRLRVFGIVDRCSSFTTHHPRGYYPAYYRFHTQRAIPMATNTKRHRWCSVRFGHVTRPTGLDHIHMYMDDILLCDNTPVIHVANLATIFTRLLDHKLKISSEKSKLGAVRVDFHGHVISTLMAFDPTI